MRDLPVAAVFIMNLLMIYTVGRNSKTPRFKKNLQAEQFATKAKTQEKQPDKNSLRGRHRDRGRGELQRAGEEEHGEEIVPGDGGDQDREDLDREQHHLPRLHSPPHGGPHALDVLQ